MVRVRARLDKPRPSGACRRWQGGRGNRPGGDPSPLSWWIIFLQASVVVVVVAVVVVVIVEVEVRFLACLCNNVISNAGGEILNHILVSSPHLY